MIIVPLFKIVLAQLFSDIMGSNVVPLYCLVITWAAWFYNLCNLSAAQSADSYSRQYHNGQIMVFKLGLCRWNLIYFVVYMVVLCFRPAIALYIFFDIQLIWTNHINSSSIWTPKDLVEFSLFIGLFFYLIRQTLTQFQLGCCSLHN